MKMPCFVLAGMFTISACTLTNVHADVPAIKVLNKGDSIVIQQALQVPAHSLGVVIQNGEQMTGKQINKYYANCRLELSQLAESQQLVEPGTFSITNITAHENYVQSSPVVLAGTGRLFLTGDGGATAQEYTTIVYIHSAKQPNVNRLTCSHWEDPTDGTHLTLSQIQATLGSLISINP